MAITVVVRLNGENVPYTFDDNSREAARLAKLQAETQGTFVAWLDDRDKRAPKAARPDARFGSLWHGFV